MNHGEESPDCSIIHVVTSLSLRFATLTPSVAPNFNTSFSTMLVAPVN